MGERALEEATAVRSLGAGAFDAVLDERFTVGGMPNGGYLLALLATAATEELAAAGDEAAVCLGASASYVRAPRVGPARLQVGVDRRGARVRQLHAELVQSDRTCVRALLTMGRRRAGGTTWPGAPATQLAPRGTRVAAGGRPGEGISILERVDVRLDPATPLRPGRPGTPEVRAWLRLDEDRDCDEAAVLFLLDVLPPASVPLGSTGWAPTIQLSAAIRSLPRSRWLRGRQLASWVEGGLCQQRCELWDEAGGLVGEATQLAMVRFGGS